MAVKCSALSLGAAGNSYLQDDQWQVSMSYRWLHSDRHFRGTKEEPERQADETEVINDIHTWDLSATYGVTPRLSLSLTVPFTIADRSSLYEHGDGSRHTTRAGGLGDLRLVANSWVLDPKTHDDGNFGFGLGVKAPTGEDDARDTFHTSTGPVRRAVDQSIQPGDGGWGIVLEVQGFQKLCPRTMGYLSGTYLMNPKEKSDTMPRNTKLSVSDQYSGRVGLSFAVLKEQGISLSAGMRIDGVPVRDLVGGSDGFRRPGFGVSFEPGLAWSHGSHNFSLTAPIAVHRNRERSVLDVRQGIATSGSRQGQKVHGDAAFADYFIVASYGYRF